MPVLRGGKVVGVISRRDLLRLLHDTGAQIQESETDLPLTVVIVDDDASIRRLLAKLIHSALGDVRIEQFDSRKYAGLAGYE